MKTHILGCTMMLLVGCNTASDKRPDAASTTSVAVNADFLVTRQAADHSYGYTEANPIKVGGPDGGPRRERLYLTQLAGPTGEAVSFHRIGSCCPFSTEKGVMGTGLLDKYEVSLAGDPSPKILFLNMYEFEEPQVPHGFTIKKG